MAESSYASETLTDEIENLRHYSVLNVPRSADLSHIQRSFKHHWYDALSSFSRRLSHATQRRY
jgi:hypothetical protein